MGVFKKTPLELHAIEIKGLQISLYTIVFPARATCM